MGATGSRQVDNSATVIFSLVSEAQSSKVTNLRPIVSTT